jgi:hypothetical protein
MYLRGYWKLINWEHHQFDKTQTITMNIRREHEIHKNSDRQNHQIMRSYRIFAQLSSPQSRTFFRLNSILKRFTNLTSLHPPNPFSKLCERAWQTTQPTSFVETSVATSSQGIKITLQLYVFWVPLLFTWFIPSQVTTIENTSVSPDWETRIVDTSTLHFDSYE